MSDKIDVTLQVLQTTIRVIYEDITRLEADVLVCPDDVLLTMKGSVSTALHTTAGSVTEIIAEISEIKLRIEQYNQDIQKAEEQHTLGCQDLEGLRQRRQRHLTHED